MPVTRSAKKKLRADERKTVVNLRRRRALRDVLRQARESKAADTLRQAISAIDKAVKNHLIHANKGARLKSQLTKGIAITASAKKTTPSKSKAKSTAKKAGSKKKPTAKKSKK